MIVLGLNAYHADAAAALISNGRVIAAAEEERFRRIKHWAGFPIEAIRYCLAEGGIHLDDVDCVAVNSDPKASLGSKVKFAIGGSATPAMILDRLRNRERRASVESALERAFPEGTFQGIVQPVEHHLSHLASAFFVSPFERAAALSLDGFGDFSSGAWGLGEGTRIGVEGRISFPHSLGVFYQALTQYLGFPDYGDEYKVMGLAPYGEPTYLDEMRRIVHIRDDGSYELQLKYFRHHRARVPYEWENTEPRVATLWSTELEDLLGPARVQGAPITPRHTDIARSIQAMYEEAFFALLNKVHRRYGSDQLVLAGGCAMNSVANGKIYAHTPFRKLYIQASPGDAGGAIGAALAAWHLSEPDAPRSPLNTAALGPSFTDREIGLIIKDYWDRLRARDCAVRSAGSDDELCNQVADHLAVGKVVGWFQGRMEWGPRTLGNRCILADPRREDMKDILNAKIKRRESFRPFAPSILREAVAEWFEVDDDVPFMTHVYGIREEKHKEIPAVTHVDGTGRLHTVTPEGNALFHRLIRAFRDRTGVPILLNTSFNENEPVVCRPQEALDCFLRTNMDLLVMGRHLIERKPAYTE
ncbi:MAG: carbamoyltransferase [Nitrospirota bacterium]|nr:carbamoyltransferase [Nitrospirota bacterium]